jgi:hypothetical protein
MMRNPFSVLALALMFLTSCSIPDVEHREPKITMAPAPPPTVRTLAEARMAQADFKGSPFPQYDARVTGTVRKRWEESLKTHNIQSSGKVVLEFRLAYDGRVTELRVADTDMTALPVLLCQQAVVASAPFDPWPPEMRRLFTQGYRDVRIRFNYQGEPKPKSPSPAPNNPPHPP